MRSKKKKIKIPNESLTWRDLNAILNQAGEKECQLLLEVEKKDKKRVQFMTRIYGRLNRMRTERERLELMKG